MRGRSVEKKIEVRAVSILLGALALAVALILVVAPPGETQTAPEADLELEKYAFDDIVAVGDEIQFSIGVSNLGPNVASNVTVTDVLLPATVEILFVYVGQSEDEGSDSCTTSAGNVITCDLGDIAPGIESSIAIGVCATEPGIVENTATVDSDTFDPNPTNNTDTATTTVIPETPEPCPEPFDPGDPGPNPPTDPGPPHVGEDEIPATVDPAVVYAPSIDADQETDQDSGDVDQQMEGSPGGSQDANTGNFAVPNQDINW